MKLIYITLWDFRYGEADGVVKKIKQQIDVFKKAGLEVDYTSLDKKTNRVLLNENKVIGECKGIKGISASYIIRNYLLKNKYQFVFMRSIGRIDFAVLDILKVARRNCDKIVFEIPTYPYEAEMKGFNGFLDLLVDRMFRSGLKKYVDRIAAFSNEDIIYGVKTLPLQNGVDFETIREKKVFPGTEGIHMICVANIAPWHGYDRMIRGIAQHLQEGNTRPVYLHVVGDGASIEGYRELIREKNLQDYVFLYGRKSGEDLDLIYDKCNLAVDCLALHRKNIGKVSSIKSKEYLAKGLPIIYAGYIDSKTEEIDKYFLGVPESEEPINIEKIVEFYDTLYSSEKEDDKICHEIRCNARKYYDISVTFKNIVEYYLER